MSNSSLTHKTLKNASYSFLNYIWSIVFALFITPIIVFKLGVDNYGVYIFVGIVASIVGLIDLGLSTSVFKYISEYSSVGDNYKMKKLIGSSNTLFLIVGLLGFLILSSIGFIGELFINNSAMNFFGIKFIFLIAGITFFVNAVESVFTIIPRAVQRYDISAKIGVFSSSLPLLGVLLLVLFGFGLREIFILQLFFSLFFAFILYFISRKLLPVANFYFNFDLVEIKKIYKFGFWAFISNFSGQALAYFDKLIIPIFINPASLSYYSLPGSIASKGTGILSSINSVLFPVISSLRGVNNRDSIRNAYIRSFRLSIIFNAAMTFSICIFSYEIMKYWLDDNFAEKSGKILFLLGLTYFFISIYDQMSHFLLGLGRSKILATFSFIMMLVNIVLLFVFLPKFGIMGAAMAYLISLLPTIYLVYYIEKSVLQLNNRFLFYFKLLLKIFFIGFLLFILSLYVIKPLVSNFFTLLVFGAFSVILYLILFYIFHFYEKDDLESLNKFKEAIFDKLHISIHRKIKAD